MTDKKENCWSFMKCGREPGGKNIDEKGICPAAKMSILNGFNQGVNSGRACWFIAGTFCPKSVQGTYAQKIKTCMECDFYKKVHSEDGTTSLKTGLAEAYAYTHIGKIRKSNEDRYFLSELDDGALLLAIADGMGGEIAGDYAAEITTGELASLQHIREGNEKGNLCLLAQEIDLAISDTVESNPELEGMGSTLVCLLLRKKTATWVNVGDSRLYLYRDETVTQLTQDQTLGRFLLEEGEITNEEYQTHYSRDLLEQCIGCGFVEPETGEIQIKKNDLLILTTDGLHNSLSENDLAAHVNKNNSIKESAKSLVNKALKEDGSDNISIVLIKIM